MATVFFQDGYPAEVEIDLDTLWEMYSAVLRGDAEIKIRVKWGSRGSLLYNLEYINAKRTFESIKIPSPPDTVPSAPPSIVGGDESPSSRY